MISLMIVTVSSSAMAGIDALRIDFQDTQPKYNFNASGEPAGLCYQLLELISKNSGLKFNYPKSYTPQKRLYSNIERGTTDIHCGLKKSVEREKVMNFSDPLYNVAYMVLARKEDDIQINDIEDLKKMQPKDTVLAIFGTTSAAFLKKK
jgi:ABC-type amino acid transport substrate-binding protein